MHYQAMHYQAMRFLTMRYLTMRYLTPEIRHPSRKAYAVGNNNIQPCCKNSA